MVLPSVFCLLPSAFAQGLFPPGSGNSSRKPITTAPQSLTTTDASRDSTARRGGARHLPGPRPDTVPLPYNLVWGDTTGRLSSLIAGVGAKISSKKTEGAKEVWTVDGLIAPNLQSSMFTFEQGQLAALEFDYGEPDWTIDKYNEQMGQFRRLLESKCEAPGELVSRGEVAPPEPSPTPAPSAAPSATPTAASGPPPPGASPTPAASVAGSPAPSAPTPAASVAAPPASGSPTPAAPAAAVPAATPASTIKETLTGYQWKHGDTIVQLFYFAAEDPAKNQNFRSLSVHYHYTDPYAAEAPAPDAATTPPTGSEAAPAVGAATEAAGNNVLPADPAHPAPGVTVTPPRKAPKGSGKNVPAKPTPPPETSDPLPEH